MTESPIVTSLQKWSQRMVALGIAGRPDLLLSIAAQDAADEGAVEDWVEARHE